MRLHRGDRGRSQRERSPPPAVPLPRNGARRERHRDAFFCSSILRVTIDHTLHAWNGVYKLNFAMPPTLGPVSGEGDGRRGDLSLCDLPLSPLCNLIYLCGSVVNFFKPGSFVCGPVVNFFEFLSSISPISQLRIKQYA